MSQERLNPVTPRMRTVPVPEMRRLTNSGDVPRVHQGLFALLNILNL